MDEERMAEIRQSAAGIHRDRKAGWPSIALFIADCLADGTDELLAEVDRLRAECADRDAEAQNLRAEVERLRAEVKRLESTIRKQAMEYLSLDTEFHIYQSMVRERQS